MDFLTLMLSVSEPSGMWESIIKWIQGGVGNYAITIILLTLLIKVVLLPLDFYQKYITKVNQKKQAILQPEIDKINARYGHNKDLLNQKTMELYKRENYNVVGTCVGMLLNLVLTMVVFFTLFAGINKMQYYTIDQEYQTLKDTYVSVVVENYTGNETDILATDENGNKSFIWTAELPEEVKTKANDAVLTKYDDIKTDFLWIKNAWIPDNWKAVIPDYDGYLKNTDQKAPGDEAQAAQAKLEYNTVMGPLMARYEGRWNGALILPLLAVGFSILSTMLPTWLEKMKAKRHGVQATINMPTNKTMLVIMPIILGIFTLFYNSVFAIYIVTGSIFGLITSPIISMLSDIIESKVEAKQSANVNTVSYSRKRPVDITNMQQKNNKNNNNKKK